MADINIYGKYVNDTTDQVVADSKQIQGGYMVLTTAEMNALPNTLRRYGMLVYDSTDKAFKVLTENDTWEKILYSTSELDDKLDSLQLETIKVPESDNEYKTISSNGLIVYEGTRTELNLIIPSNIDSGWACEISFATGNQNCIVNFTNSSSLPFKIKNKQSAASYQALSNAYVNLLITCNGLMTICSIEEII